MTTKTTTCYRCASSENVKPWGPGRSLICPSCAQKDPELDAIARMYSREDGEKRKAEMLEKLRRQNPGMAIIELPISLIGALMSLSESDEPTGPCDCPRCSRKRAEESRHAN